MLAATRRRFIKASWEDAIRQFFRQNPNPDDAQVHDFARSLGTTPEALEGEIYRMFTECNDQALGAWYHSKGRNRYLIRDQLADTTMVRQTPAPVVSDRNKK